MRLPTRLSRLLPLAALPFAALPLAATSHAVQTDAPAAEATAIAIAQVAGGLSNPWGMAFLPSGDILVTERPGRLTRIAPDGDRNPVVGVPEVAASGQGGLLDVALDPAFETNRLVYLSYSEPGRGGSSTAVARGRLSEDGSAISEMEVIFSQRPKLRGARHFGSRLAFASDGTLFITLGDRGNRPLAQDASNEVGTIVRINPDGTIPSDNPFLTDPAVSDAIFSFGHRNVQGAHFAEDGTLWTVEHGARGGDEINRPQAGKNYGWPTISYGRHYSGGRIGEGTAKAGLEQPVYYWDPSIAPSGLAVVEGSLFQEWDGDLLVGALKDQLLARLTVRDGEVVAEERLLAGQLGRIRDVTVGPDGAVYVLSDAASGGLYRLTPGD